MSSNRCLGRVVLVKTVKQCRVSKILWLFVQAIAYGKGQVKDLRRESRSARSKARRAYNSQLPCTHAQLHEFGIWLDWTCRLCLTSTSATCSPQ